VTDPLDLVERLAQACDRLSDFTHGDVREAINDARAELTRLRVDCQRLSRLLCNLDGLLDEARDALREKGAESE